MYRCDGCGREHPLYNSCRNRHCPTCQGMAANRWSEARAADILPVPYFHVVFTLPKEIAAIAFGNRRVVFDILFRIVAETLRTIAADRRHGGIRIGGTAVLHTWDQKLLFHPHLHVVPDRRWQRTVWRQNTVHPDYHIAIDYHFYSVPHQYVGKEVDVRLRGSVIDVFHRGRQIASHLRSQARGRATTVKEHRPLAHQRAGIEDTRARLEDSARDIGPNVHAFVVAVMDRNPNPEFGFRSCYGVLRLANGHEPDRFDAACRYALELGTRTYRGLDNILRTGADLADAEREPATVPIHHPNIRGPEAYK